MTLGRFNNRLTGEQVPSVYNALVSAPLPCRSINTYKKDMESHAKHCLPYLRVKRQHTHLSFSSWAVSAQDFHS